MKENEARELSTLLGLDKPMDPDAIKMLSEGIKEIGDKVGDTNAEEVRDIVDKAMNSLKDDQTKAMVITYLLSKLPVGLTNFLMENVKKLVIASSLSNVASSPENSMLDSLKDLIASN